jgi:hypothetical protein
VLEPDRVILGYPIVSRAPPSRLPSPRTRFEPVARRTRPPPRRPAVAFAPGGERRYVGGRERVRPTQNPRMSHRWVAFTGALVLILIANCYRTLERGAFDSSPFAEPWSPCDRMAYGWPFSVLRVPLISSDCPALPDIDLLAAVLDAGVAMGLASLFAIIVGFSGRVRPGVDAAEP